MLQLSCHFFNLFSSLRSDTPAVITSKDKLSNCSLLRPRGKGTTLSRMNISVLGKGPKKSKC